MWFWWLILLVPEISYASKEGEPCANLACDHDNVNVCGVRTGGTEEVTFRLFQDECALRKFECEETEMKGFRSISLDYCTQAFSLDTRKNRKSIGNEIVAEETEIEDTEAEEANANTTYGLKDTRIPEHPTCIQCDCNIKSKTVCAIRPEGARFIVRWFADDCHMLQYNCESNLNFSVTDDNICVEDKNSSKNYTIVDKTDMKTTRMTKEIEHVELFYEIEKADSPQNAGCIQSHCIPKNKRICAIRPEAERFIIRRFSDECDMLQYNCEKHVNFAIIEDSICIEDFFDKNNDSEETHIKASDIITEAKDTTELLDDTATSDTTALSTEELKLEKGPNEEGLFPNNVVVSRFDMKKNINQTVKSFFAASHLTGIRIQKFKDEASRRMIVKDTGPVNLFVPRAFVPANYTPVENRNQSKDYPEYSPLVKYCYHKCPKKCPEYYKPVCGARIEVGKQTPFIFFKNHCYMDVAKCEIYWAGYKGMNYTILEELGFIWCGGMKMMNMMHTFPLIRILQKMGRLKKKGKIHFNIRNLGQVPIPLQG